MGSVCGGDVGDEHAVADDAIDGHVVVLGVPDPPVAVLLGAPGERDAAREAVGDGVAGADDGEVEDRQRDLRLGHGSHATRRCHLERSGDSA